MSKPGHTFYKIQAKKIRKNIAWHFNPRVHKQVFNK